MNLTENQKINIQSIIQSAIALVEEERLSATIDGNIPLAVKMADNSGVLENLMRRTQEPK